MNRTDRLYAIVEELRARAPRTLTAGALADRFEVSTRTVERDISALQQAGVPIWSQPGRDGGYGIDPTMTLPPINFSPAEAMAVVLALAVRPTLPFAAAGRAASRKLLAAMPTVDADTVRDLAERTRVTPPNTTPAPAAVAAAVEDAVTRRAVLAIEYVDRHGRPSVRAVEAHGLHLSDTGWYLIAWCREKEDGRVFRLDRMVSANPTGEVAPPRDLETVFDAPFPTERPEVVDDRS